MFRSITRQNSIIMIKKDDKSAKSAEAGRILETVEKDSNGVFTGALHQLGKRTGLSAGDDVTNSDPVEKWGRIVGRTLGFGFLIVLIVNLFTGWFF